MRKLHPLGIGVVAALALSVSACSADLMPTQEASAERTATPVDAFSQLDTTEITLVPGCPTDVASLDIGASTIALIAFENERVDLRDNFEALAPDDGDGVNLSAVDLSFLDPTSGAGSGHVDHLPDGGRLASLTYTGHVHEPGVSCSCGAISIGTMPDTERVPDPQRPEYKADLIAVAPSPYVVRVNAQPSRRSEAGRHAEAVIDLTLG